MGIPHDLDQRHLWAVCFIRSAEGVGEHTAKHATLLRMALRSCLVSCRDLAGTEHAVEVTAESLYEAVAQALGIMRGDQWVEEIGEGLTELKVRVKQPAVEHRVTMKDFRRWLESQGRTPAECTRKRNLMVLVKGGRDG